MKWLGKWLIKLTDNARKDEMNDLKVLHADPVEINRFGRPLNITVYNAHGGKIITFQYYDKHNDRSKETTYIIHPDEEFSDSLGKLIAMEEIKHVV